MKGKTAAQMLAFGMFVLLAIAMVSSSAVGNQEKHGRFGAYIETEDKSLTGKVVLASAIQNGVVVVQEEEKVAGWVALQVPVGEYDVRIEGEGIVTEVKRGVHTFQGKDTTLHFKMHAGTGVHIVEYATGGLSREEVAARLAKLESDVASIKKKIGS